jgi:hypothetical protein
MGGFTVTRIARDHTVFVQEMQVLIFAISSTPCRHFSCLRRSENKVGTPSPEHGKKCGKVCRHVDDSVCATDFVEPERDGWVCTRVVCSVVEAEEVATAIVRNGNHEAGKLFINGKPGEYGEHVVRGSGIERQQLAEATFPAIPRRPGFELAESGLCAVVVPNTISVVSGEVNPQK